MNQNKTYFNNNLIKLCSCYYKFTLYTFVYLLVFFNNMLPDLQVNQVLILGDCNSCELSEYLPALKSNYWSLQWKITNAYKANCRPPLGKSDHNVIHLLPKYCFEETNWDIFFQSCQDADELTDTITSYIKFCEDSVSETKSVKCFPNNKPWVSRQLKMCLNERKVAFCSGNTELRCVKRRQQKLHLNLKWKLRVIFNR